MDLKKIKTKGKNLLELRRIKEGMIEGSISLKIVEGSDDLDFDEAMIFEFEDTDIEKLVADQNKIILEHLTDKIKTMSQELLTGIKDIDK